ncbi:unnamed protein product, partial [marine sediment metagenome]
WSLTTILQESKQWQYQIYTNSVGVPKWRRL